MIRPNHLSAIAILASFSNLATLSAQIDPAMIMTIKSTELAEGAEMAEDCTCRGLNVRPPLTIDRLPEKTASVVLIMEDLDAIGGAKTLWVVTGIQPDATEFERNELPLGALAGKNDLGKSGYSGPCPESGVHRYQFTAYALRTRTNLQAAAKAEEVLKAMEGNVLQTATLITKFSADEDTTP